MLFVWTKKYQQKTNDNGVSCIWNESISSRGINMKWKD